MSKGLYSVEREARKEEKKTEYLKEIAKRIGVTKGQMQQIIEQNYHLTQ